MDQMLGSISALPQQKKNIIDYTNQVYQCNNIRN